MGKSKIEFTKFYLPNGLKCILYRRPELHSVHISVQVNVGSLDENEKNNGLSHLLEHLPFNGTRDLPSWSEVDRFNNNIAGSGNAYTSISHTKYYGIFPSQYIEQAIYYYSQLVLHPLLKDEEITKEKDIILDEMKRDEDTVESKIYDNIRLNRFEDNNTSYSYKVIGSKDTVSKFTRKELLQHYDNYYVPENMEIYIVGNFNEELTKRLLNKYFCNDVKDKDYAHKPERKFIKEYPEYSKFKIHAVQKGDLDQYYLTITFPGFGKLNKTIEDRLAVPFLEITLASPQYQHSVLWRRLREELGLVYGVNAYQYDLYQRSMFIVETSFNPEYLETILKEIYDGINKIKQNKVTDEIFKTRQKRLLDIQLMTLDNPENVLNWIEEQEEEMEYHGKYLTIEEYINIIKNYKFEDVINTSTQILDWNNVNIGIVSSHKPQDVVKEAEKVWNRIVKK